MSIGELFALFLAMLLVALVPGPAVFSVVSRTFSSGFPQGLMMIVGISLADFLFILLALFGLSVISEVMGTAFLIIKYLSAAYLIWLGINLIRKEAIRGELVESKETSLWVNLLTGVMINLGNPKAIVFYIGLFPAFINVGDVMPLDALKIMLIAAVAFGSVNIGYAILALKAKRAFSSKNTSSIINKVAGSLMVFTGAIVAVKN